MNESAAFAYFLVDCARYRSAPTSRLPHLAHELRTKYLSAPGARGGGEGGAIGGKFPVSLSRGRPLPEQAACTVTLLSGESSVTFSPLPPPSPLPPLSSSSADWVVDSSETPANTLGITGGLIDQLVARIDQSQSQSQSQRQGQPETFTPALFDELEGVVFSLTAHKEANFKGSPLYNKYINIQIQLKKPVAYKDFQLFRTLGRGGFGLVNGCKKTQSGQLYAMKALCRKRIKLKRAAELCLNEKSILQRLHSPFIVCMQYAFTSPQEVYLILDLMVGGDLGFYLRRNGSFSAHEGKYFVARTVLGLKALHDARVVYRDLKPENILMDSKGRTKISDLGE
jgi:hypothetical protein